MAVETEVSAAEVAEFDAEEPLVPNGNVLGWLPNVTLPPVAGSKKMFGEWPAPLWKYLEEHSRGEEIDSEVDTRRKECRIVAVWLAHEHSTRYTCYELQDSIVKRKRSIINILTEDVSIAARFAKLNDGGSRGISWLNDF